MNKTNEKEMVIIAKKEIKKFAKEWRKNPYLWESETDIHAELYCKIKASINKKFKCEEKEKCYWEENGVEKTMPTKEYFDWVYCKPATYIKIKGKRKCYYPDIVIYKNTRGKHVTKEGENTPMLWACEIKYATEWSSDISDSDSSIKKDGDKLKELLKQKNRKTKGTDSACLLVFSRWMKQYDSKPKCDEAERALKNRVEKIDKRLKRFNNKGIDTEFYKKHESK